ncbi:TetR/AcrR family transcriptional regulator C-terminal domain-containing protein [Microbacterium sediminicola]|uniref:TetR/AcrR family transcriptional regulator C-terminal domain-containing protein n=1 Tax=Microbacterium sediminicola TaxID=415210 RepID=A0ABN2I876_9MICO
MPVADDAPDEGRPPLTRERILGAALAMADEQGIGGLTMRALGKTLDVEAMSIYHHLPSKQAVIDGIVDLVWAEVTLTPEAEDWRRAVRRTARSVFVTLLHHPWANRLRATSGGPARMTYINASLAHLRTAGFTPEQAFHAHHVLEAYIQGYVIQAVDFAPQDPATEAVQRAAALEFLTAAGMTALAEHVELHGTHLGSSFDFGLTLLLDGLERRLRA